MAAVEISLAEGFPSLADGLGEEERWVPRAGSGFGQQLSENIGRVCHLQGLFIPWMQSELLPLTSVGAAGPAG